MSDHHFVEKEDDGGGLEPLVVADRAEQFHGLVHSVDIGVFLQHQVVLGHCW